MLYLSRRAKAILYKLYDAETSAVTSQELALATGVSTRTIKKDVRDLADILENYGASIEVKLAKGYSLKVNDDFLFNQFLIAQRSLDRRPGQEIPEYRYERVNYIIKKLLAIDYSIRLEYLIDELFVSRTTITGDLKEVREILQDYDLKIVSRPNYGISLEGEEINKRLCISEYYFHSNISTGFFAADHAMFVSTSNQQEISCINEILMRVIREHRLNIPDFSFQSMVIHIVIAIRRWRFYNYAKISKEEIRQYREFEAGKALKEELESWLNIVLPIDEAYYFTLHFHSKHVNELNELNRDEIARVERVLFEIYRLLQNKYGLISLDKRQYEEYVRLHIPVMVERLKTGMVIRNPQMHKILSDYPLAVHLTYDINRIIENDFDVKMNVNEFTYLVLYTNLLIINSQRQKMRILLACCQGRPEMITILNDLNEHLANISRSIDICDYYKLDRRNLNDYDLLITTVPFQKELSIPIVQVSDAKPYWIQIRQAILEQTYAGIDFRSVLKPRYFLNHLAVSSRNEVLLRVARCFNDSQSVYKQLFECEQKLCQETNSGVVYLHTQEVLEEDFILIAVLKKPIIWKKQWIQMVFWINCKDSNVNQLTVYYRFAQNLSKIEGIVMKLLAIHSFDELNDLIESVSQQGGNDEIYSGRAW